VARIKREHGFTENRRPLRRVDRSLGLNKSFLEGNWTFEGGGPGVTDVMFTIGDREYTRADFGYYLAERQGRGSYENIEDAITFHYPGFVNHAVREFKIDYLETNNTAFRNIVREYRDGLLLFEVMEKEVWNKASQDSAGLAAFFEKNSERYKGATVAHAVRFTIEDADKNTALAPSESGDGELKNRIGEWKEAGKSTGEVIFTEDRWSELGFATEFATGGIGYEGPRDARNYYLIRQIEENAVPPLNRIRGRVVADYQDYLEKKWVAALKEQYQIEINQEVLESIVGR
jgi:peptidyl-prolyl cis-trans isomerase SurA